MANGFVGQIHIGSDDYLIGSTLFATSSSTASAETKTATLQGSAPYTGPVTGITVHVRFANANSITDSTKLKLQLGTDTAYPVANPNGSLSWSAGSVISFTLTGTTSNDYKWVMNSTGIDGSSIQNLSLGNITSEGKILNSPSSLVVTNSNSEITAGASFTSAVTSQDQSTTFLRSDGTWAAPSYTNSKSQIGLDNVTNHAQVTSLQWNTTDKKITYKVSEGTATNLLTFVQGNNITLTAASGQLTIAGTANNAVTQTNTTTNASYNILFSSSSATTDTKTEGAGKSANLTYNPSTGTLSATKFSGDGSSLTNVTASSVANNLVLKFDSGSTEGTSLYTYNGSAGKTIDIKAGNNISLTATAGEITIAGTYSYTLPIAKYDTLGGLKPAYSSTGAATLTTAAASNSSTPTIAARTTTSGRYYGIEVDKNGVPFVNVPWTDTKVKQTVKSDNNAYKLLFSAQTSPTSGTAYEAVYASALTFNPSSGTLSIGDGTTTGTLTPTQYSGNAATATSASSVALANVTGAEDLQAIEALTGTSGFLTKTAANTWALDTNTYATTATVNGLLAAADAMTFKGTIAGGNTGTYGALTNFTANAGDTYKVTTAGKINGVPVEVGDLIICTVDSTAAATTSNYATIADNWVVVQTNIDGAVTGPASSTANHIATFNGTSGKVIKDSGITVTAETTGFKISGGTTSKTLTVTKDITLGDAAAKGYTDSSSASAIGTGTSLVTERDVYYGLPTINGAHDYNSGSNIYAPTSAGTSGQFLVSSGSGAPTWTTLASNLISSTGSKGDIIYWSAADTPARLAASTDGYVLTLDNGAPSWKANQATDEKLAIAAANPSSLTTYYPIFGSGTAAATRSYNDGLAYITKEGTTSAAGDAILQIGNAIATGTNKNKTGRIRVYGTSTTYLDIVGTNTGSSYTLTLPNVTAAGNLVGTSTTGKVGDTNKPVYIAANGVATAISYTIGKSVPSDAVFTDTTYTPSFTSVLNSLTLAYNDGTAHSETPSSATFVGTVSAGVLYLKSVVYGTTSVVSNITAS